MRLHWSCRIRAVEHWRCAAGLAGAHTGLQDRILINCTRIVRKKTFVFYRGLKPSLEKICPHRKNVLDVFWNYWIFVPLLENSSPPGAPSWLRAWKSSKRLIYLFPCWDIIKCLNASMLTTAVFELVQQFYPPTEIGNVANAVSACADQP